MAEEETEKGPAGSPPEPIAGALVAARQSGRRVFIDFTAVWCAPCKVIEQVVMPDEQVQRALQDYILLRVDTDENPAAVAWFRVAAMPTLLILDQEGVELTRLVGPVTAVDLAAALDGAGE
jgi:thiol:disulfide interchange protein